MSDTPRPLDSESEVNGRIRQLESELAAMIRAKTEADDRAFSATEAHVGTMERLNKADAECAELREILETVWRFSDQSLWLADFQARVKKLLEEP
jgi:hypothetical protein